MPPQRRTFDYEKLRAARQGKFTTRQVAKLLGITVRTVENYESNKYSPRADQLAVYAACCGRPVVYFFPVVT